MRRVSVKAVFKALFSKFAKAINTYDLIQPGDKIAVCISGGKDSHADGEIIPGIETPQQISI